MPWRRARFKGSLVHVECDDGGQPLVQDGRVSMRYRLDDERTYRAALRNVRLVDDAGAPAAGPRAAGSASSASAPGQADGNLPPPAPAPPAPPLAEGRLSEPLDEPVVAYTDGACLGNPGPAGLGVVLVDDGRQLELSHYVGHGTNNVAELAAIGEAARALSGCERLVRIHTDSQYAIGVLTKGWKAKANRALVAHVKGTLTGLRYELIYVRGHSGIPLNERADELAVQAAQNRATSGWA